MRPRAQVRWLQLKVGLVIIAAVAGILVAIMNLNEGMGLFRQQATFRDLVDDSHRIKDLQTILTGLKEGKGTAGKLVTDPALFDHTTTLLRKAEAISDKASQLLVRIEKGEGTLGQLVMDRAFYDRAAAAVDELQKVAALLNQPNGSLGRLARDPSLYQRLEGITTKSEALVGKIERGDGTLGKLVTQEQLYQRADKVLTEMETLLADVKKNPTKYFKFSVF